MGLWYRGGLCSLHDKVTLFPYDWPTLKLLFKLPVKFSSPSAAQHFKVCARKRDLQLFACPKIVFCYVFTDWLIEFSVSLQQGQVPIRLMRPRGASGTCSQTQLSDRAVVNIEFFKTVDKWICNNTTRCQALQIN